MTKSHSGKPRGPAVNRFVKRKATVIAELCREHHVDELYLFGSAASGEFEQRRSDLDFLVRFKSSTPADHANRYFGLLAGLRDLFHLRIDLLELDALKNPYFRASSETNRVLLYAAHA